MVTVRAAIRRLEDFGLVQIKGSSPLLSAESNQFLVIHQLTRSLLSELRYSGRRAVNDRIMRTVGELIDADHWAPGDAVPWDRSLWAYHLLIPLATVCRETSDADLLRWPAKDIDRLARLIIFMLRAMRQLGLRRQGLLDAVEPVIREILILGTFRILEYGWAYFGVLGRLAYPTMIWPGQADA